MNKIIIIGSGIAGITFAEKLRQLSDAHITILTTENYGYYSRPLLSRGFSNQDIEQAIIIKSFASIREQGIEILENMTVSSIDRNKKLLNASDGGSNQTYHYDKLIIATGSAAFIPPPFLVFKDNFFLFNSLKDLKQLRGIREQIIQQQRTPKWGIIGGGLIGCELASDLAVVGDKVELLHAVDRLMERQLVAEDSLNLLSVMQNHKIDVYFNQMIQKIEPSKDKVCISTEDYLAEFDAVIVACGFKPRIELAQKIGLEVNRGIRVNHYLQSSDEDIFALGDVAEFPDNKLYAYILPIRKQALWLAGFLSGQETQAWLPPDFNPRAKVHGFEAIHPYTF